MLVTVAVTVTQAQLGHPIHDDKDERLAGYHVSTVTAWQDWSEVYMECCQCTAGAEAVTAASNDLDHPIAT